MSSIAVELMKLYGILILPLSPILFVSMATVKPLSLWVTDAPLGAIQVLQVLLFALVSTVAVNVLPVWSALVS